MIMNTAQVTWKQSFALYSLIIRGENFHMKEEKKTCPDWQRSGEYCFSEAASVDLSDAWH
jgi:hypothetical protein